RFEVGEAAVGGGGDQLRIAQRVAYAEGKVGVFVAAGVADERPAWSIRLAQEVGHIAGAEDALGSAACADAFSEAGRAVERVQEVRFGIGLDGWEFFDGKADEDGE